MKKNKKIKRIGIDARMYGPLGKGLGRYIQEIVDNIIKIDSENEYVIFLCRENFDEFVSDNPRVKKVLADVRWYTLKEQILMPFYLIKERLDLVHFPHFNVPVLTFNKFVVTIHDLILTKFPTTRATTLNSFFYRLKNWAYKLIIWLATKRSEYIITVSEFTKKDIVEKFKIEPEKILVTYEGVANLAKGRDSLFVAKMDDKKTLLSYNIEEKFLLYVGNAYPHKNLEGLLEAFKDLIKQFPDLNLVLVGKEDFFYEKTKKKARDLGLWEKEKQNNPVIFPGYVPDEKLEILYARAFCYVFPSFYEGFGLPPLEAMAKNCPVISSNQSSMPEVLGDAALYFNPYKKREIINIIKKILNNPQIRLELKEKGRKQARKYNWWECARETREIYQKIFNVEKKNKKNRRKS